MAWQWIMVALGGAIGACGRYGVTLAMAGKTQPFPWATLTVNVVGSAVMAIMYVLLVEKPMLPLWLKPLVMTGMLGAFTTFSTFSMEAVLLLQKGAIISASGYVIANACVSILAFCAALTITRILV